jgi:hypothetical protein
MGWHRRALIRPLYNSICLKADTYLRRPRFTIEIIYSAAAAE